MPDNVTRLRNPKPCPICGKPSVQAYHPFCSTRCADLDLGRWLKGSYVIPGKSLTEGLEDDETPTFEDDDE
ncbi:DNA gyrase inhibitor YacG [Pelagibacterium xiamenense]|uniref:DNA gyrase inhibitor YacG n=1 Tax=Pelagibacterium xiamenense TaxID=2901140 RepID=UPI001E64C66C|nr:DNA gyrase inhibitor YacG [Pelagibacterium xiamenense]MCD7059108.1 DNA gyrase inhibitor YacG [Pelagibacterium xiamenense]